MSESGSQHRVGIVGGGLAGLATAVALSESGFQVELFESRRALGGRAGSFEDSENGTLVDHCQHVGMGCCTNLQDFCCRTGIEPLFRRFKVLHFFGPDGRRYDLQASSWLPAPLHLAPSLLRLGYLSLAERISIAQILLRLSRTPPEDPPSSPTIGDWLRRQRQTRRAIDQFWSVVLVSALGESIDRASLAAARKVFVDGFMSHRDAYHIDVPNVPLGELYGTRVAGWLRNRGVTIHLANAVKRVERDNDDRLSLAFGDGESRVFDFVVVALPWRRVGQVVGESLRSRLPALDSAADIESSPITAIHLWFDRPITSLPHAVLIDRLSQWVFNRGEQTIPRSDNQKASYYQVVISASHKLAGRAREEVVQEVLSDVANIWPAARTANLLYSQMITERDAVFSAQPSLDRRRPPQATAVPTLFLAGDWTRTGWPSTMEGAVRSGYLAAEGIVRATGGNARFIVEDLPRGWLARWILGRR